MTKRQLSASPNAVAARERRFYASIDRQEREWRAEVLAHMKNHGVDFETAFVACGGTIIDNKTGKVTRPPQ